MDKTTKMTLSIGDVEKASGISREALRKWETRYGFPRPRRDAVGERIYSEKDLTRLQLIKSLMNTGLRPAAVVPLSTDALQALKKSSAESGDLCEYEDAETLIAALKANDTETIEELLQQNLLREGLSDFVSTSVVAINSAVGDAWQRGEITIYQEHLYTEVIRKFVLVALELAKPKKYKASALLATPSGEQHSLGLLMVQCILTLAGYRCHYLGTQLPVDEIAQAAIAFKVDLVALSMSITFPKKSASSAVTELRNLLPAHMQLWVGGAGAHAVRKRLSGVRFFNSISQARSELGRMK